LVGPEIIVVARKSLISYEQDNHMHWMPSVVATMLSE
jgi:hypothetical protein